MADEKKAKKTEEAKANEKKADSKKSDSKKSDKKTNNKSDKKSDKKKSGKSPLKSIGSFFKGVRNEGKKVVWPKPLEVVKNTIVVLVVILILGLIIFGIDQGLSAIFKGVRKVADERTTAVETTTASPEDALADLLGGDETEEGATESDGSVAGEIEAGIDELVEDAQTEATTEAAE